MHSAVFAGCVLVLVSNALAIDTNRIIQCHTDQNTFESCANSKMLGLGVNMYSVRALCSTRRTHRFFVPLRRPKRLALPRLSTARIHPEKMRRDFAATPLGLFEQRSRFGRPASTTLSCLQPATTGTPDVSRRVSKPDRGSYHRLSSC